MFAIGVISGKHLLAFLFITLSMDMAEFKPCNILGAILDGTIVANLLFGIFTLQVHSYYRTFSKDQRSLKILVTLAGMHVSSRLNTYVFFDVH